MLLMFGLRRRMAIPSGALFYLRLKEAAMGRASGGLAKRGASSGWKAFSGICVMLIMWSGVEWYCMSLYADPIIADLGISRTAFMLVLTLIAGLSATVSLTCFGALEQRFGVRKLLLAGGTLDTIAFLVLGCAQSLPMLYLGGFLYGVGTSVTGYNMAATAINHWFSKRRGSMVGVANTVGSVSGIVFSPIIALLISFVGWRMSFFICFALSAVCVLAVLFLYRGNPEDLGVPALYSDEPDDLAEEMSPAAQGASAFMAEEVVLTGVPYAQAIRTKRFWVLAVSYFIIGMSSYGIMGNVALFSIDFGYPGMQGIAVSVSLVASAALLVPLGAVCDRFGSKWALTICCVSAVLSAALLCMNSLPIFGVLAAAALSGVAYNSTIVPVSVSIREAFGELEYSKKLGFCAGCATVGISAGPTVTSLFYDLLGSYHLILLAFVVLCLVAAVVFHLAIRTPKAC